ncbi:hypothetical protein HNP52_001061 [Sphingomonas kyeonggiensis]|uniref:Uncharacterized protein n=1 Tax=Sphingomonas kyeonggiensis TaxID=1268553 RepID=A0A7W7NQD7_9SPHN|nr:hypothetical protein [Sphingomonas kyeonggiensis]MBB4838010.1 hypothetical protein [Sphingomonas kyeonggiensis]
MARVEIFRGKDDLEPFLTSEFGFLPRIGEYLAIEADGYFHHYNVVEIWHRRDEGGGDFIPCIRVELDD